ncbi:phage tail protein [Aurantiacibacter aquimixticola]|uniref:Uncharacterized protein n=1 Tax=Aurantiacibacter aquimixticola TaxID=1958945 RepID=A0A419RV69_9SPHN|nr:phage tail protein [Aurantiacibacter aquimixticola]RJY09682.1 hypothetical protein D6201_10250 [Aurantiacibacter aquimixticola]
MATLVLSSVGSAILGPIGAVFGSSIGSKIDAEIFGTDSNEGPRLTELKVTTSSYGAPVPRHFGTMRAAGTIIWATDLQETSEKTGGGKGQPSTTTFAYSISFAVALASRPIARVGRIWADGNLLRGAAGDLKVPGTLRIHDGAGDQPVDPLLASAEGSECPAYRGFAYGVFEDLQLAEFGNRIPALTFEVVAEDGDVSLATMLAPLAGHVTSSRPLGKLRGYSDEGGPLASHLAAIDQVYPLASDASGEGLAIGDGAPQDDAIFTLPEAVVDASGDSFGDESGRSESRRADAARVPAGMRYYDVDRDYQAGLQRASGRADPGRNRVIEFPGALTADSAKSLADAAASRAFLAQDRLAYRIAEIDPRVKPGQVVALPDLPGRWRIEAWEWRDTGVELELLRLPSHQGVTTATQTGRVLSPPDLVSSPTTLYAFELPWDGAGETDTRQIYAAASSSSAGWKGSALYAQTASGLSPIGATGSRRSVVGTLATDLSPAPAMIIDRHSEAIVSLASTDFVLESCTLAELASGANRALVGEEILQFCHAERLGDARWRLSTLLRGRGGTEDATGAPAGAPFVLLDGKPIQLDTAKLGDSEAIAAIGLVDTDPVIATIALSGASRRPLTPVHPRADIESDGGLTLGWTRRARGAWRWPDGVEVPLVEQTESYEVGLGSIEAPRLLWQSDRPSLRIDAATLTQLRADHSGQQLWVRQIGTHARSHPLALTRID